MDVYSPVRAKEDRTTFLRQFVPTIPPSLDTNPVWDVSTNSTGFRDKKFPTRKSPSDFRILYLGDSWTFGSNDWQKHAYPRQLERALQQKFPQANFQVLNLGVLGYSSYQSLEVLKTTGITLEPDLVLIGFGTNDASVVGWQDKDSPRSGDMTKKRLQDLVNHIETYKLLRYLAEIINHTPCSMGDYLQNLASVVGTAAEAWIGREGHESAKSVVLGKHARVSPRDYERNIVQMIDLARRHGADVIVLYNELWDTPYRHVLKRLSKREGIPLVNSKTLIDRARSRIEQALEARLDLQPPSVNHASSQTIDVVFRVYSGKYAVPDALYLVGHHPKLGDGVPNHVAMYDDGTHGDQRAGDHVWSYSERFPPGTKIFYVYTNSGERGKWQSLDIPDTRGFTVQASTNGGPDYRPIDTFGEMYMQADCWHTNARGYELIAQSLLHVLSHHEKVLDFLAKRERVQA